MLIPSFFAVFSFYLAWPVHAQAGILDSLRSLFSAPTALITEGAASLFVGQSRPQESNLPSLEANAGVGGSLAEGDSNDEGLQVFEDSAILAPLNPLGIIPQTNTPLAGQIFIYTIRPGDTSSSIAQAFDITVNTILWANNLTDPRSLRVGDKILILPVPGVRHEIKKGDTIETVAKRYKASADDIIRFNGLATGESLRPGEILIIPNGELPYSAPLTSDRTQSRALINLPNYPGYYIRPIVGGRKSRGIHGYNGVDLANSCGFPVLASAEGQVLVVRSSGWNGGYGRYLVISHPNSTQTLYAHLKEIYVKVGQTLTQGQVIAVIGSSGNSTGCHVHFEVRGARNPF